MKKYYYLLLFVSFMALADNLTISNETDNQLYARAYYVPMLGKVTPASETLDMPAGSNNKLERPSQKLGSDRILLIRTDNNFPDTFTKDEFKNAGSKMNVGNLQGKRFYIGQEGGRIIGYTVGQWSQRGKTGILSGAQATLETLLAAGKAQLSKAYKAVVPEAIRGTARARALKGIESYWNSPYEAQVAHVRVGNNVAPSEQNTVSKRLNTIASTMQSKFGAVSRVPRIAVVASGGGYRAMIFTLGFLVGAQKTGLFDMTMWMTVLSGSTWALGTWLSNNALKGAISAEAYRTQFLNMIKNKGLETITTADMKMISNRFIADLVAGKPFTLINLYGALLANRLLENFGDQRQTIKLSDQQQLMKNGKFPIPIYTAVSGEENQPEYYWYGFTPWEVSMEPWKIGGSGISVPTWGYGRVFRNGASKEYAPEQSIGFEFGTYGSAFAADLNSIYEALEEGIPSKAVREIVDKTILSTYGGKRLTWAAVPNFGRGVTESPLRSLDGLQLVDAGLDFNLPYPPISGMRRDRAADIIIFVDVSHAIIGAPSLKKVEAYARSKGLKFPPIDYSLVHKKGMSIHMDKQDPSVPVVIYIPRINDEDQAKLLLKPTLQKYSNLLTGFDADQCTQKDVCGTFNFKYTYDEAMKLSTLGEFNVVAYIDEIFAVIKQRAGIAR